MEDGEKPSGTQSPGNVAGRAVTLASRARVGILVSVPVDDQDVLGPVTHANPRAAAQLGRPEGFASTPAEDFVADWERDDVRAWARADDAPASLDVTFTDTSFRLVPGRIVRVDRGGRRHFVHFVLEHANTTLRRRAERALETSESRFRSFIDSAPVAVLITSDTQILYANQTAARLAGVKGPSTLVGRSPLEFMDAEESYGGSLALSGPRQIWFRGAEGNRGRLEVLDLETVWRGTPALLTLGRDTSARKEIQAQLIQADRLASVGTLAAGVAHEINNPLAYVMLNLQYLLKELPRLQDPERLEILQQRLEEARHGARRVSTIVRDLKEFSRRDRNEETTAVDLMGVLANAIKVASPHLDRHVQLEENYDDVPPVFGNAARLEQVFLNLLVNAAQALPKGRQDENRIWIDVSRADDGVIASVKDNGPGIPRDLIDRVFDPFFTTKPRGIGTGLGLPICHNIVSSLGGDIAVRSERGRGTTFQVTLLVADDAFAATPSSRPSTMQPPPTPDATRFRVLVVDDELPVANMLSRLLADEHEVHVTTSGKEALDLMLDEDFDVVLCDLLMPGMSGMDLHHELEARRPGLETRLVFMTGGAFTPRAAEFLDRAPNRHIEKPFDLALVQRVVRDLARRGRGEA